MGRDKPRTHTTNRGPTEQVRATILIHVQRERHTMAQGGRTRTRGARYRQGVGSDGCSEVMRRATSATTTSTAASCHRQSQQQS